MKMKLKAVVAAVTMAAAVQANAAINSDEPLHPFTGTGDGEMFLSVVDRGGTAPQSYVLDLGVTANGFRADPAAFSFSQAADGNLSSLLSHAASDGGSLFWNLAAMSNKGTLTDYGFLTTSGTPVTLTNTPIGSAGISSATTNLGLYLNAVNFLPGMPAGNAANGSVLVTDTSNSAFYDNHTTGSWGSNWDNTGRGTEAAIGDSMGFYFVGLNPADNGLTSSLASFSGVWTLATDGTLTYGPAGGPAPVPLPPALWLLGSALVGMVGVARRRNASTVAA